MPYLNLDVDFLTHLKTKRLLVRLGHQGLTYLLALWTHAAKHHAADGILKGYQGEELDMLVGYQKDSKPYWVDVLVEVGFLDRVEGCVKIHNWEKHAGHLIAFKERAISANKTRWEKYIKNNNLCFKDSLNKNKESFDNPPNHTIPILTNLTKPIKRGERARKLEELEAFRLTPEIQDWAKQEFGVVIPDDVLAEFKDHWRTEKKLRTDWLATFKNRIRQLVNWGTLKPKERTAQPQKAQPCQERVQRGNFLKPCGEPSVGSIGGRPLCNEHKERHERTQLTSV